MTVEGTARLTFLYVSLHDGIKRIFFTIKHPGGSFENGNNLAAQLEKSAVTREWKKRHAVDNAKKAGTEEPEEEIDIESDVDLDVL